MELRHLRSFVAVAERLSFIQAARQLHISQPALSAQIQHLEDDLKVQLLQRDRRSVRLTPAGEAFLAEALATLKQAEAAVESARRAASGETGILRIGFVASAALELIPSVVLEYRKKFPGVKLELENLRTTTQLSLLRERVIDIGYVRLPVSGHSLVVTRVHREPFALILPATHRFARSKSFDLRMLEEEPFIAYARQWAPGFYDRWISIFTDAGFSPSIVQETGDMYTAVFLVAAGAGISVIPRGLVARRPRGVVVRPLPEAIQSEIGIAVRAGDSSPLVRGFLALSKAISGKKT